MVDAQKRKKNRIQRQHIIFRMVKIMGVVQTHETWEGKIWLKRSIYLEVVKEKQPHKNKRRNTEHLTNRAPRGSNEAAGRTGMAHFKKRPRQLYPHEAEWRRLALFSQRTVHGQFWSQFQKNRRQNPWRKEPRRKRMKQKRDRICVVPWMLSNPRKFDEVR